MEQHSAGRRLELVQADSIAQAFGMNRDVTGGSAASLKNCCCARSCIGGVDTQELYM